ncbi:MAG: ParB/RepB/Spo0J family partition protein [Clostridia bacterium]|nr:ParB/RepB/Spo0J family partition protein [Clostridia bacterium]
MSLKNEMLTEIPLSSIKDFPDHPYKVRDDENMVELVESVKTRGLIQPVLVRPLDNGMYEIVSGHRRKRAFEIAGIEKIPARVQNLTRDEAILSMVDSNLQRDEILPSEKAFAYKMRLEAMKRQGQRTDLTSVPSAQKSKASRELLGEQVGESQDQVRRYIRLTYLIPELINLVDEKKIAMRPAVEISYLTPEEQLNLADAIDSEQCTPSHDQTLRMKRFSQEGKLTKEAIEVIMSEEKPNQREKSPFRDNRISDAIPQAIPKEKQCDFVIKAIEHYTLFLQSERPVQDLKYDILKHPNVKDTTDGRGENYVHGFEDFSSLEMIFDELDDISIDDLPISDVVIYSSDEIEEYLLNNLEE